MKDEITGNIITITGDYHANIQSLIDMIDGGNVDCFDCVSCLYCHDCKNCTYCLSCYSFSTNSNNDKESQFKVERSIR